MTLACTGTKKDGTPCRARAQKDKTVCLFHDLSQAAAVLEAKSRGGKQRHADDLERVVPETQQGPKAILNIIKRTIRRVRKKTCSASEGSAIASLCGVALKAINQADTDSRVEELERRTEPLKHLTQEQLLELVERGQRNGVAEASGH